ncbi:hypothetical protein PGQ11_010213 [Apiospora arundinis]|uniref:Chromo domain-containing protein n=1 Tax=Apiospora arundinis TaxID=335852 RepID=A0ABR2I903_9PEZI
MSSTPVIVQYMYKRGTFLFSFQIQTEGKPAWKDENDLQRTNEQLVYDFWDNYGGRDKCLGKHRIRNRKYHVFKILEHKYIYAHNSGEPDYWEFKIHWVGYPPTEATWEKEGELHEKAPRAMYDYFASHWKTHFGIIRSDTVADALPKDQKFACGRGMLLEKTPEGLVFRRGPTRLSYSAATQKKLIIAMFKGGFLCWHGERKRWHVHTKDTYSFWDDADVPDDDNFLDFLGRLQ